MGKDGFALWKNGGCGWKSTGVICGLITQGERRIYEVPGGRGKRDAGGNPDCLPLYHPGGRRPHRGPQHTATTPGKTARSASSFKSGWTSWRWRRRSGTRSGPTWSKTAPTPRPGARMENLERRNNALQEIAGQVDELRRRVVSLEKENRALEEQSQKASQLEPCAKSTLR